MSSVIEELSRPGTDRGLFYAGAFQQASHGGKIRVLNPATGAEFTTVPDADVSDVAAAVAAAKAALPPP